MDVKHLCFTLMYLSVALADCDKDYDSLLQIVQENSAKTDALEKDLRAKISDLENTIEKYRKSKHMNNFIPLPSALIPK